MTLDPVQFDGIARLVGDIDHDVDETDHREFAETVWKEFLDPLRDEAGKPVLEPMDELKRQCVPMEAMALQDDQFPTVNGLDAGTLTPKTFKNGLVVDIAHAAMSASPSDLDLHRSRTAVAAVHSNDNSVDLDTDWEAFDEGFSRRRRIHAPTVDHYEDAVVHALALYAAESQHALAHADDVADLLVLDGPIYPKGILKWLDRRPELAQRVEENEKLRRVTQNYVDLVETFVERDVPLAGFVKNISSKALTTTVRKGDDTERSVPWAHDAAFFTQVLERRRERDGEYERVTDELTFTNWFTSRAGADRFYSDPRNDLGLDRALDRERYEVTFFVVYDPRTDLVYKAEAPRAFTDDEETRERLERQLLTDIALRRGPPLAVDKADELARIRRTERDSLIRTMEEQFGSEVDGNYNTLRWE